MVSHQPSAAVIEILAPAKVNLFLEVLARRSDGFHEIETLMVPIDLYDTLSFTEGPDSRIVLSVDATRPRPGPDESAPAALPPDSDNLIVRALEALRAETGCRKGARLRLVKRIPMASGLAGGSTDAAAALLAGNALWRLGLSRDDLLRLAAGLGSDIPFFLEGGAAICRGRGERIEPVELPACLHLVLVRPPVGLSTPSVFRACRPAERPCDVGGLLESLKRGDLARAAERMHNRLEPAAATLTPWMERLQEEFRATDVCGARMTGSGSTWFGLCRSRRHATRVAARLRSRDLGNVFVVKSQSGRVKSR